MSKKIAYLFPGQGSQYIGMGRELSDEFSEAREIFQQADEICRRPITRLCFDGPMDELTLTVNLQPAVTAVNLACLVALNKSGTTPAVSAGHSLGEYAAMTSAGIINGYDALKLVAKRGELMHRESLRNPGAMAAIIGLDIQTVSGIVEQAAKKGVIAVANHNTAEQVVVTGEEGAVSFAVDQAKERGGKAIPLKVSGAWHCSLMKDAVSDFLGFMNEIRFSKPETSMLFNSTAKSERDPEEIKRIMANQLISPVKWHGIILKMMGDGIDVFVEVGPKAVLSGLLKKILPTEGDFRVYHVEDLKSLQHFIESPDGPVKN